MGIFQPLFFFRRANGYENICIYKSLELDTKNIYILKSLQNKIDQKTYIPCPNVADLGQQTQQAKGSQS